MLSEVDEQLGHLVEVGALSSPDDTIVVVTSDHGEQLGDHWLLELLWFDSSYHIPLLIRAPAPPPGPVVDSFTESIDLVPTLLDRCGIEHPAHLDGASLAPLLDGGAPPAAGGRRCDGSGTSAIPARAGPGNSSGCEWTSARWPSCGDRG